MNYLLSALLLSLSITSFAHADDSDDIVVLNSVDFKKLNVVARADGGGESGTGSRGGGDQTVYEHFSFLHRFDEIKSSVFKTVILVDAEKMAKQSDRDLYYAELKNGLIQNIDRSQYFFSIQCLDANQNVRPVVFEGVPGGQVCVSIEINRDQKVENLNALLIRNHLYRDGGSVGVISTSVDSVLATLSADFNYRTLQKEYLGSYPVTGQVDITAMKCMEACEGCGDLFPARKVTKEPLMTNASGAILYRNSLFVGKCIQK